MRKNHLRELLNQGLPSLGTHLHSSWPTMFELVGHSGAFDYVEFLAEYAPYDLYTLENIGRAIELFPNFSGMVKVEQEPRNFGAAKALASGIQNILFADARTVEDVRDSVAAVRSEEPSLGGKRGVAMSRDAGVLLEVATDAWVQSTRDSVVALMIEKKDAVENLEALLTVPGVDMVQFGPSDYAVSCGLAGKEDQVRETEEYVIRTALKHGIQPRAEIQKPEDAERYLKLGVRHFCMGWDVITIYQWCKQQGGALREILKQQ